MAQDGIKRLFVGRCQRMPRESFSILTVDVCAKSARGDERRAAALYDRRLSPANSLYDCLNLLGVEPFAKGNV